MFQVCREQKERDGDQEVVHSTEGEFEDWERKSEIDLKEKKRKWTGDKFNLLVVNKADFLTLKQRYLLKF